MSIFYLFIYVLAGILFFISYYHLSNSLINLFAKNESKNSSLRALIFILPAFIILTIFILYPVIETIRLSFFNKTGFEFVGLKNYFWAVKDPEFKRAILNNLGW